jgi:single-stranded DNA-binding protein
MNDMNSLIISGRLTKAPVKGISENGCPFCMFTIASHKYTKDAGPWILHTTFIDCSIFGGNGENFIGEKGMHVRLVGALNQDKFSKTRLVVEHYEFLQNENNK